MKLPSSSNQVNKTKDEDNKPSRREASLSNLTSTSLSRQKLFTKSNLITLLIINFLYNLCTIQDYFILAAKKDYYYTRTRYDPNHLRVSEGFKNRYVNEIKLESRINGTRYEYYKSSSDALLSMSHDELVFETLDKIFQHRLSAFYIHHYDNDDDKRRSFDPKIVSNEACARDLMYLVDKVPKRRGDNFYINNDKDDDDDDYLTPELEAFFDSYARQESGLLMGNTYWVGAYDQCVNRHIFELSNKFPTTKTTSTSMARGSDQREQEQMEEANKERQSTADQQVVDFKGRYCVASLKSPQWDSKIRKRLTEGKNYFKTQQQMNGYSKLFRLQVGICLPSSCDSTSFERHSDEIKLLTTSMLSSSRFNDYNLIDLYCLPDETSPLRSITSNRSALYLFIFLTLWFIMLFLATIADLFEFVDLNSKPETRNAKRIHKFVCWFSLRANYIKLMKVNPENEEEKKNERGSPKEKLSSQKSEKAEKNKQNEDPTRAKFDLKINLRFLNAFKVLVMFWIVNGHIMLLMIQTAKNILYSDALLNGLMHFLIGATFGVDLFFTMTGFLTSYLIFNSGHAYKMKPATWLYLTFHRYWRLAPMYLLTFWFSRSAMQLLGSGPLWDYGTSKLTFRGLCNNESWWYPLTLTSNLHGLFEECLITSWYISCDMQFWLVSPIYLHLLAKKPLHGWMAALATIFMSSKFRYDSILTDQSARYDELVQPRADIFMRVSHDLPALYTHPHFRISAYIVGLLAGHYVYMIKSGKWKSSIASSCVQVDDNNRLEEHRADRRDHSSFESSHTDELDADKSNEREEEVEEEKAGQQGEKNRTYNINSSGQKEKLSPAFKEPSECDFLLSNQVNRKRSIVAYTGLYLFLVMSFVSYLLSHYYPSALLKHSKSLSAIAYSVDHLVMSLGASMVIVSMCFGQWSKLVTFLSHPIWTRLSKINYALLLLQCEAIYYQIFRYEQVPLAGTRELINILFNLLVTLYPLAFLATLAFEFPLANIEKLLV